MSSASSTESSTESSVDASSCSASPSTGAPWPSPSDGSFGLPLAPSLGSSDGGIGIPPASAVARKPVSAMLCAVAPSACSACTVYEPITSTAIVLSLKANAELATVAMTTGGSSPICRVTLYEVAAATLDHVMRTLLVYRPSLARTFIGAATLRQPTLATLDVLAPSAHVDFTV